MKFNRFGLATALMAPLLAFSGEYQCKVYCKGPDGQTYVTVKADSSSDAAAIVDRQPKFDTIPHFSAPFTS